MKPNYLKLISYAFFSILLLNAAQSSAQVTNPGAGQKQMPGESAKPAASNLKGEYTKDVDCVDLVIHKGCVNYTVSVKGDNTVSAPVKVCYDPKSVNKTTPICRKGAKGISVKYEKLDGSTDVEFMPAKAWKKQ